MLTQEIKIVMVGTTHPGNIGAAARAMHTMCFSRLALVDPRCDIDAVAYARASGADHILDDCQFHDGLADAIADCDCVVATSARRRSLSWPESDPAGLAEWLQQQAAGSRAAIVFGPEHSGLSNDELQLCNRMVVIPTNPEFGSLNVAAAIQILCYQIFAHQHASNAEDEAASRETRANSAEVESFFTHLQQNLERSGFLDPQKPGQIMQRLRRLYLRSDLTRNEINILRGTLNAIDRRLDR